MSGRKKLRLAACVSVFAAAVTATQPLMAQNAEPAPVWQHFPKQAEAPAEAPNILLVLTDDVGFGASSTFGGAIPTPTLDRLAENGLRYNSFHTAAMCSPTRAALLTGRNHHAVGAGSIANFSYDADGYTSVIPESAATVGRVLRDQGYDTAWFGKNHNTPEWELGPMGPFDRWPNGMGFDYFYGFSLGATHQVYPDLIENRNRVERDPADEDYFLDRDLADHMIDWMERQHTLNPEKPFFAYLAPGTLHIPQQAPKEWIAKFEGRYDQGWDVVREEILARQKAQGIVPEDAVAAPRPPGVPSWDSLNADQKRLYARLMEVAAAQLSYLDFQFGRVIGHLEETGQLDNTLVVFIQGDNGASLAKMQGSANMFLGFQDTPETVQDMLEQFDELGGANTTPEYPVGWAFATNTPFPWGKQVASHLGALRDGMVVSWPSRIKDTGTVREQFTHVTDIAPTLYEAAGIEPPETVDGVEQQPFDGVSMVYTFDDADAQERHSEQYFEILGNRAFYRDGWMASTNPTAGPWEHGDVYPEKFTWSLFNLEEDFAQTRDVSGQHPAKLDELQEAFEEAAERNHVYPLQGNLRTLLSMDMRPRAIPAEGPYVFRPSDTRYALYAWPSLVPGWNATAKLEISSGGDSGPIFNQGDRFSGYRMELKDGKPSFTYDPTGRALERAQVAAPEALSPGEHTVKVAFAGHSDAMQLTMSVDGEIVDQTEVGRLIPLWFGTAYVGHRAIDDLEGPRRCECEIETVTISAD